MSNTAIFRADARPEIGSGHVMRSLTLAHEWIDHGGEALLYGAVPAGLIDRINAAGVEFVAAEEERALTEEAKDTIELATKNNAEWIVVDGYVFDSSYVNELRSAGGKVLQFADGATDQPYAADILLDQNLGAEQRSYELITPGANALLGINYACLGRQFRDGVTKKTIADQVKNVMVTFGGSDAKNATSLVLDVLAGIEKLDAVVVVIGVSNQHIDEIVDKCRSDSRLSCVSNVNNMAELMADADLAIAAGGSTSWELAALGVPSILAATADNHEPIAKALAKQGVAESVGWIGEDDIPSIRSTVEELMTNRDRRQKMSLAGQALVDGLGSGRVVNAMLTHSDS